MLMYRNLRRRSASSPGPGALAVDPDLPPPSPTPSASASYTSNDDVTLATPDGLDDGSLFWVPAHLHPELAPGEFKAFLKAHTSADPEDGTAENAGIAPGLARSGSWLARSRSRSNSVRSIGGNDGLGRKRSMLSRQYQPRVGDTVEEEVPPIPARQRGSIYGGKGGEKGLTLQDLQRLETMVDQVEEGSEDPSQMRSMLRRSLSMNVAPGCKF